MATGIDPPESASHRARNRILQVLAHSKVIRNTPLDPFRYTSDRRAELALLKAFELFLDTITATLSHDNYAKFMTILSEEEKVRGFGQQRQRASNLCIETMSHKHAKLIRCCHRG